MSNQILLKKSSIAGRAPTTGALAYGELAINYTDGNIHYKTAGNTIDTFASISATATLTNKTLTTATLNGTTTLAGSEVLITAGSGGSEGGELHFQTPATGSTLSGPIAIDIYQNKLRIFETTGTNRGVYIDLTAASGSVGTNLLSSGSGTVTSITAGTGLTGGTITSSGTIAIDTGVVVTLTGSQTLTNKTLTSPTLTTPTLGVATATSVTADTFITTSSNIITDATTSRTLTSTDNGKIIYFTSSSAVTVTTASGLGAGFRCEIIRGGTGTVTVAAGAGTTANSASGYLTVKAQYGVVRLLAPVSNTFIMTGDYETNYLLK